MFVKTLVIKASTRLSHDPFCGGTVVLPALACGHLLFVSTIYYLCTYLYCGSLPGQPCEQNAPALTYTGKESIFPPLSPRPRVHVCACATHTQASHKNAHLPLSAAHLLQSRLHEPDSGTQDFSTSECVLLSVLLLFLLFSYFANVGSRSPYTLDSFKNTHRERHSVYWLLQSCRA